MTTSLPHAWGGPLLTGTLRARAQDFRVDEELGFEPSGSGEHAFLLVEKTGANTEFVARQLASAAGVAPLVVGFAGMKDRHAVTTQYFSVQLPGRADPDWLALEIPGVRVLSAARHNRKLKRGAHRGNRFRIRLRDVAGDIDGVEQRLATIRDQGVPNYFGEQRFGRDGQNVAQALAMFAGRNLPRPQRSMALSAARSEIFNAVLGVRVASAEWNVPLEGDVWMLDGTHAIFGPEARSEAQTQRCAALDIHPTGPMWGAGELRSEARVRDIEAAAAADHAALSGGLERARLDQERRALRLRALDLRHAWEGATDLVIEFRLTSGAFATTVLRELCDWSQGTTSAG